jgi:hypothetical protein
MRRCGTLLLLLILAACEGPLYPVSPDIQTSSTSATPTRLTLLISPAELPEGGGTASVFVETSVDGQRAAPRVRVGLTTSAGTLEPSDVTTDETGHARVTWTGSRAAIVVASAGHLVTQADIRLAQPFVLPPTSVPPPAPPAPTPDPVPTPTPTPPAVEVSLQPSTGSAPRNINITFFATVMPATLQPNESVVAYLWDFQNDGTVDATTTTTARAFGYATHGVYTAKVTALTSLGREGVGTTQVVITN